MRSFIVNGSTAVMILSLAAVLSAQSAIHPERLVGAERESGKMANRVWIASMLAMAGASGADAATSYGKYEGNSLLASPNGRFGVKGLSFKAGIAAAVLIPQILLRRHRDTKRAFATVNFGGTAVFSAVAVHNMGIAKK